MKRSTQRILTTHVGSLARPHELLDVMREKEHGRPYDTVAFDRLVREAVGHVVKKQVESGIDIVADGEMGKVTFLNYVKERLGGFVPDPEGTPQTPQAWQAEVAMFPEYYKDYFAKYSASVAPFTTLVCTAPIVYTGQAAVQADIATLKAALEGLPVEEAFMSATSPHGFGRNAYYATEDEYVEALGEAMREEYLAIIDAGLILQVDDPWITEVLADDPSTTPEQRHATAVHHIEMLKHCLRGLPSERVRLHVCYGLNHGPRLRDPPMREWVDLMLRVNVGAYSFEVANPRHQHEWRVWESVKLPEGKVLIPGLYQPRQQFRRTPGADRRRHRDLRAAGRPRERHCRRGLRLLVARQLQARGLSRCGVGQVQGARRGRAAREPATVGCVDFRSAALCEDLVAARAVAQRLPLVHGFSHAAWRCPQMRLPRSDSGRLNQPSTSATESVPRNSANGPAGVSRIKPAISPSSASAPCQPAIPRYATSTDGRRGGGDMRLG